LKKLPHSHNLFSPRLPILTSSSLAHFINTDFQTGGKQAVHMPFHMETHQFVLHWMTIIVWTYASNAARIRQLMKAHMLTTAK